MSSRFSSSCAAAVVLAALAHATISWAQASVPKALVTLTPHDQAPTAIAARRNGPIQIDGKLDEAAWDAATPVTDFRQSDPTEGAPASEKNDVRILVDDEAIYVGWRAYDSNPAGIQSQLARRDDSVDGDIVEVSFDSYHDHLTGYIFRLSAGGARRDATVSSNLNEDASWDAVWEGATSQDSRGWYAEFRIPLSQLRYNRNVAQQVWGLQLGRKIARKGELDYFSLTPKTQQSGIYRYGHLTGLGNLPSARKIELVPYVLAKNEYPTAAANDPFQKKNHIAPGVGLDLKYGVTSNMTLDATINPDFGQVEVDPAVVNLSAYETFFPEQRPFFIAGSSVFNFGSMRSQNQSNGYNLYYTRRIGHEPQRFISGPDIEFVDAPLQTRIDGAAKLTGRTGGGLSVGVLDAVTAEEDARIESFSGGKSSATVEPRSNYFMTRVKHDFRQGNTTIGFGATAVNRDLADSALVPLFVNSAYAAGIDWQHAWSNQTWAFDGDIVASHAAGSVQSIDDLQNSPVRFLQRPDKINYRFDPAKTSLTGHLAELTFAKLSGTHWTGSITYQEYSPTFEVNDAGFLSNTDMRSFAPIIGYSETKPGKFLRNWLQFVFWNPTWDFDRNLTFNGVGAITIAEDQHFWDYRLRFDWRPSVLDPTLLRGGPVARLVQGGDQQISVSTDRRKSVLGTLYASYSYNVAGGKGVNLQPGITMRPSTAVKISLAPTYSWTHALAQYVTASPDPLAIATYGSRYVFATL
jgi:hypothetical protein